jgi:hypothetical protein
MVTGHTNDSRRNNASRSADTGRKAYLVPRGGGREARHWDHGRDPGNLKALSVGKHEAVSGPAFNHRGCRDLR